MGVLTISKRHLLMTALCVSLVLLLLSCKRDVPAVHPSPPSALPDIPSSPDVDDDVESYSIIVYFDSELNNSEWSFDGPGPDGTWFTLDDQLDFYSTRPSSGLSGSRDFDVIFNDPGPDGQWLTGDDVVGFYFSLETLQEKKREVLYEGPGPDKKWFTDDDEKDWDSLRTYDTQGNLVKDEGCSYDTDFSRDDPCRYYHGFYYDAEGNRMREVQFQGPGPDNVRFTDDDEVSNYSKFIYDADGTLRQEWSCSTSGEDGRWFTNDDKCGSLSEYVYGPDGAWRHEVRYSGGRADKILGTTYDFILSYTEDTYDERGNWTRAVSFGSPGEDLVWFTGDDEIGYGKYKTYTAFLYNEQGRRVMRITFNGPGPNGVFFK